MIFISARNISLAVLASTLLSASCCSSFTYTSASLRHIVNTKTKSSLEASEDGSAASKNSSSKGFGKKVSGGGNESKTKKEITVPSVSASSTTTAPVIEFPVKSIKIAPLRFFIQIYLAGEQKDSGWFPKQSDNVEVGEGVEAFFMDGSAMCLISFQEDKIQFIRYGERPSLQYMLQESLLIHRVLDELNKIVFEGDDDIDAQKRLLALPSDDTIEKVREQLPARKEQ